MAYSETITREVEDPEHPITAKSFLPGDGGAPVIESYTVNNPGGNFGDSGGGGGKSKPTKKPKKSGTIKRYKELDDSLNEVSKAYDKVNKQADKLFGKKRLDAIDEQNKLLQKQITLLRQKLGLEAGSTSGDIETDIKFD
jgi:hypothetical protein